MTVAQAVTHQCPTPKNINLTDFQRRRRHCDRRDAVPDRHLHRQPEPQRARPVRDSHRRTQFVAATQYVAGVVMLVVWLAEWTHN